MRALLPLALSAAGALSGPIPDFPETRKLEIIKLIWQREGGGTVRGLAQWNDGETFASIGAAHYLWYPDYELCGGTKPGFEESLPALIEWMISERRVDPSELPTALGADGTGRIRPAPWCTRRDSGSPSFTPAMNTATGCAPSTVSLSPTQCIRASSAAPTPHWSAVSTTPP